MGYSLVDHKWNEEMRELQIPHIIYRVITDETGTLKDDIWISAKRKKNEFGETSKTVEGFCFILSVAGNNKPSTGRDDDV